jgi:ATP dependent DNA ligase domain
VALPIPKTYAPMEASSATSLPVGPQWQYEPKWDGFRCLAFGHQKKIDLQSKSGKPLTRYFPELVDALSKVSAARFVLDGEIVIPLNGDLSFDELLMRIHPSKSRVEKTKSADALLIHHLRPAGESGGKIAGRSSVSRPPSAVRPVRFQIFEGQSDPTSFPFYAGAFRCSKMVCNWHCGRRSDGEAPGSAISMREPKGHGEGQETPDRGLCRGRLSLSRARTAGRLAPPRPLQQIGCTRSGRIHLFNQSKSAAEPDAKTAKVDQAAGLHGAKRPEGPSRWSSKRSSEWQPLDPTLVAEVQFDHFTGGRFRHGTKFLRWRPDKKPAECTIAQVQRENRSALNLL